MKYFLSHILIFAALLLTSCADDAFVADFTTDNPIDINVAEPQNLDGVYASLPELIDGNAVNDGVVSRSSLYHDKTSDKMLFSWGDDDTKANMGVFHPNSGNENNGTVFINFKRRSDQTKTALNGIFEIANSAISALTGGEKYIAFRPFTPSNKELDYKKIDVSYTDQSNAENVKRKYYYTYSTAEGKKAYDDSEKAAGAHLGAYDYLVSAAQTTNDKGGVSFSLNRVGVVVNFFIKCPDNTATYEQVQLVTQGNTLFTLNGTLDLTTRAITPVTTHNVMVMKYGDSGLCMNNEEYQDSKKIGYIITYMMLAPVDLKNNTSVHLYLVTKDSGSGKKYYKSEALAKPTLTSNMFYRWRNAQNPGNLDQPITFTEVTFQEWQAGTAISNGESGTGTEGW